MFVLILCLTTIAGDPVCLFKPDNLIIRENVPGYKTGTVINTMMGTIVVRERMQEILDKLKAAP